MTACWELSDIRRVYMGSFYNSRYEYTVTETKAGSFLQKRFQV